MPAIVTSVTTPQLTAERVLRIERLSAAAARLESRGDYHAARHDLERAKRCWRCCGRVQHHARRMLIEAMPADEVRRLVAIKTGELLTLLSQ